jgi:hypothetical protein
MKYRRGGPAGAHRAYREIRRRTFPTRRLSVYSAIIKFAPCDTFAKAGAVVPHAKRRMAGCLTGLVAAGVLVAAGTAAVVALGHTGPKNSALVAHTGDSTGLGAPRHGSCWPWGTREPTRTGPGAPRASPDLRYFAGFAGLASASRPWTCRRGPRGRQPAPGRRGWRAAGGTAGPAPCSRTGPAGRVPPRRRTGGAAPGPGPRR